ncbi:hypothetical protein C7455_11251 [Roseicyclus mahoneyensis]|uniref:Uncharacterized protein n=2 Tax=Roseicyclus mahoneyensis TaxID=164332 RepID=A0A316G8V9_9RHOB|nr:hypothetical protein C7455_11251 [Roseicyclus mahoneyensis]
MAIAEVLALADAVYGPRPLSWRAFDRCLLLALFYPLIAVVLGWALFNTHSPAGLTLFVDEPRLLPRIGRAIALVFAMAVAAWVVANAQRFADFVVDRVFGPPENSPARPGFLSKAGRAGVDLVAVAVAFAFAVAFAVAVAVAVAVAFAFAVAFAVAVAFAFAFAVFNDDTATAAFVLLLYAFLPLLNAVADWVSLAITRSFLRGHGRGPRPALAVIGVRAVADLALALVCLGVLLAAIALGLDLWGRISPATLPFTAATYMAEIRADPTRGMALYLMVATTLLPTFVHVLLGLGAVLSHRGHMLSDAALVLEAKLASGAALTVIERADMVGHVRRARWAGYGAAAVITGVLFALVLYPIWHLVI